MSKIEQTITEIEEFIDSCKLQPLSSSKIIVNRGEMEELLGELRESIPDEIKKYQRIIANRDAILKDAQEKAEEMIRKANEMTIQLVSEHEIMQKAYQEADEVVGAAKNEARSIMDQTREQSNTLRTATNRYLDDALANLSGILSSSIAEFNSRFNDLAAALEDEFDVVNSNRLTYQENQRRLEQGEEDRAVENPGGGVDSAQGAGIMNETMSAEEAPGGYEYNMDDNGDISLM